MIQRRLHIIDAACRIEAVLGASTSRRPMPGNCWVGAMTELHAFGRFARTLLPAGATFDAELTLRWGCLVACTPEFSARWRAKPAEPAPTPSFFLEIHDAD